MNSCEYPCTVCAKNVRDTDSAIQCDGCQFWCHLQCANLTIQQYEDLSESDVVWECPACIKPHLPQLNSVDAVDVFHFDFQQNFPTPKLSVGKQFYMRLLWTYLFGIYSASTQTTTAFMWHELLGKRGCNNVMSCLMHFIFHSRLGRTGAKWSIWWADNCPGQNKNNYIMWFFQDLIRRKIYSRVDYKFLIAGHTYGSTDQAFGMIERYAAKIDTVYTPQEWYEHVRNAGIGAKAIQVIEMEQKNFKDYRQHLHHLYTERKKDEDKNDLDFQHIVWFNFGVGEKEIDGKLVTIEHPRDVWVRYTYNVSENPRCVCYYKKRNQTEVETPPPDLYTVYPIPIKRAKAEDVQKLVHEYVPAEHRHFYANMQAIESDESTDDDEF